jgi:hypothetical protein
MSRNNSYVPKSMKTKLSVLTGRTWQHSLVPTLQYMRSLELCSSGKWGRLRDAWLLRLQWGAVSGRSDVNPLDSSRGGRTPPLACGPLGCHHHQSACSGVKVTSNSGTQVITTIVRLLPKESHSDILPGKLCVLWPFPVCLQPLPLK